MSASNVDSVEIVVDLAVFIAASIVPFPGSEGAALEQVGGKAHSLLLLTALGFNVPPGVVLTTHFFEPWITTMALTIAWQTLTHARSTQWPALCQLLKQQALALQLNAAQTAAIIALKQQLAVMTDASLFAVRSSSPQEDRLGASFAGGYETYIGIALPDCVDAIRRCFASMFDERVLAYKALKKLDLSKPRMAVVVQAQVHSDVAGVAFSLNPLNNDYDEAVIDANWGQGETVVGGEVDPDHWVIDKLNGALIEARIGKKQLSRHVAADGTLRERSDRQQEPCLTSKALAEITLLLSRVETQLQHPVDIEWAIADGALFLLQARPVSAFVPLPNALTTQPGQRRRLYMDLALSSGFTINAPISVLGLDVFRALFGDFAQRAFGPLNFSSKPEDALLLFDGGRMYLDLSNTMWLASPRILAKKMAVADILVARALEHVDSRLYKSPKRPSWAGIKMLARVPGAWWRLRKLIGTFVLPFLAPKRMQRKISQQLVAYERSLIEEVEFSLPLQRFFDDHVRAHLSTLLNLSTPSVGPGVIAVKAFTQLASSLLAKDEDLLDRLDRGFAGNVVVAMSLHMHRLAKLLQADQSMDLEQLIAACKQGRLSEAFMTNWKEFMQQHGHRGPMEMDLAQPRYGDAPAIALQQILGLSQANSDHDPTLSALEQIARRREAVTIVLQRAGPIRRALLKHLHRIIEGFSGLRDTPKHHLLLILHRLRQRIVLEGERLYTAGRLDHPTQVFDLPMAALLQAETDSTLDLRQLSTQGQEFAEKLAAHVVNFPPLIDSRGRIHRAPRSPQREGEWAGIGLSSGIVSGRARTLRSPHEKPLLKGEILIAYTTDPGWTPIFANAAAVVLEIGGALQHGAVVARELGLPCVAGIEGISAAIQDGQMLEVDGGAGLVRVLR